MSLKPITLPDEKIIAYEEDVTAGDLKVNDAYDLALVEQKNGNYQLQLLMRLQFFFKDDGIAKWKNQDMKKFIQNWESVIRQYWDNKVITVTPKSKTVSLKLIFETQIEGVMLDHWEITVKKVPAGSTFRSYVQPKAGNVVLTENDNNVVVRKVKKVGGFQQHLSS